MSLSKWSNRNTIALLFSFAHSLHFFFKFKEIVDAARLFLFFRYLFETLIKIDKMIEMMFILPKF